MDKPHGRDCPDLCSQCIGVKPRQVSQQGASVTVDGVPVRPIEPKRWTKPPRAQR